jgi:cytochrome c biogenesis protein
MRLDRAQPQPLPVVDRLARGADRALRLLADPRLGVVLLLLLAVSNALAAALPGGPALLAGPPYVALLGVLLLTGLAAVAVRAPAAWREWRRPGAVPEGNVALLEDVGVATALDDPTRAALERALRGAGYRVRAAGSGTRWGLHGVRRGWSRFAALGSHVALVLLFVGAGIGTAFSSETVFSLLPGEQALLDAARPGFTDALRLEALDARFGADGRPLRLDTQVTYLRDGREVERRTLQVNDPGQFGGYLVHGWTYGPAARLRVTALDGSVLSASTVPLDDVRAGRATGSIDLPLTDATLVASLTDAAANRLTLAVADRRGVQDVATLGPGEQRRIGPVVVQLDGLTAWVTFMSRRDPGIALVFGGGALLTLGLALAFWFPRRRLTLRQTDAGLRLVLRGERFDDPSGELRLLTRRLQQVLSHG